MAKTNKLFNTECRTCFNVPQGRNSFRTQTRDYNKRLKSYGELLQEVTKININDDKHPVLPQFICFNCSRRLKSAHTFIEQAKEVNEKLYCIIKEKVDCLQETQIELETCREIKIENLEQESKKDGSDLDCLQEAEINLESCLEIKIENNDGNDIMKDEEFNCLQESEMDIEEVDIGIKDEKKDQAKIKNKLNMVKDTGRINDEEDVFKRKNHNRALRTTCSETKQPDFNNGASDSETSHSEDSNWTLESEKVIKSKTNEVKPLSADNDEIYDIAVPCNKCNKIFKNSKLLAVHQRISHIPEEKKCTCHLCGNKFTRYCNMYKHMRMFHGPETVTLNKRPEEDYIYKCDQCPKKYSRKKGLVNHIKLKHSSTPAGELTENKKLGTARKEEKSSDKGSLCPTCGGSFANKHQLNIHIRRHTGERPFKCDLCERAFLLVTQLNSHKRLHTGEKPYICKICGKAFRVSDDLRQHMRTHTNARPHKCSQCEQSFKHSQDLKVHMRSHTGERPYICAVCDESFERYNTFRTHRIKMGHLVQNKIK